jgi:hypothetical protein
MADGAGCCPRRIARKSRKMILGRRTANGRCCRFSRRPNPAFRTVTTHHPRKYEQPHSSHRPPSKNMYGYVRSGSRRPQLRPHKKLRTTPTDSKVKKPRTGKYAALQRTSPRNSPAAETASHIGSEGKLRTYSSLLHSISKYIPFSCFVRKPSRW